MLPCCLQDLLENVAHPAYDVMLGEIYVCLLRCCMHAAIEQGKPVPEAWLDPEVLNLFAWPEVLRRWVLFGPGLLLPYMDV